VSAVTIRAGAPPGRNEERPTGQGQAFLECMGLGTRSKDATTVFTRWAAYTARRRLRRKRAGCRWPAEVAQ